jgi:hypothetical protein
MESVSEGGRSRVLISLKGGMSSPNLDAIEICKSHTTTVPYIEYYYPKNSGDPRFKWDKHILVKQDTVLPSDLDANNGGCEECVIETGKTTSLYCQLWLQANANQIENRETF